MSDLTDQLDRESGPKYAAELDKAAELLQRLHPMGKVQAFGRLHVASVLQDLCQMQAEYAERLLNVVKVLANHPAITGTLWMPDSGVGVTVC